MKSTTISDSMETPEIHFNGVRQAPLDSSLRLSIRADWRQHAGDLLYMFSSSNSEHPVIKVFRREAYDEKMTLIMTSSKAHREKLRLAGRLEEICRGVRPDSRNRISIPSDMVRLIGLQKCRAVTLVGCGHHFKIWEPGTYQAFLNEGHAS